MTDPKYTYYLKAVNRENKPVMLKFNFGYKEVNPISGKTKYIALRYNTGVKVINENWSYENQIPLHPKDYAKVEEIKDTIFNTYNYLIKQGVEITPDLLKSELDVLFGKKIQKKEILVVCDFIEKKIIEPKKLDAKTISQYVVLKGKLETYETDNNIKLTSENLNRNHYLAFQEQCQNKLSKSNAVWGVMKNFKSALNKMRREYRNISIFNPTEELSRQEKIQLVYDRKVYLEFNQIQTIINYQPDSERLKNVKLILLTLIFTGCRYSDVFKVTPKETYIDETINFKYARFITEKGEGTEVIVPILKPLEQAIINNKGQVAYPISDVKFNKYVKELCELAKLTEEVKLVFTDAKGNKQFESKPFFKFVSSHIGRRTFVTNLISAIPITLLSKVTGHSFNDKEIIFKYDKKTLLQNAVLFVKELKRVGIDRKEEYPIPLI